MQPLHQGHLGLMPPQQRDPAASSTTTITAGRGSSSSSSSGGGGDQHRCHQQAELAIPDDRDVAARHGQALLQDAAGSCQWLGKGRLGIGQCIGHQVQVGGRQGKVLSEAAILVDDALRVCEGRWIPTTAMGEGPPYLVC